MKITEEQVKQIEMLHSHCDDDPDQYKLITAVLDILEIEWNTIATVKGRRVGFHIEGESIEGW